MHIHKPPAINTRGTGLSPSANYFELAGLRHRAQGNAVQVYMVRNVQGEGHRLGHILGRQGLFNPGVHALSRFRGPQML